MEPVTCASSLHLKLTNQLGEYMLKGWTLTDLHCDNCNVTPLMREPPGAAAREGRPPVQFCALCDGRPEGRRQAAASTTGSEYATPRSASPADLPETEPEHASASTTVDTPTQVSSDHIASIRGDPEAAADAIGGLLLKGYSLLQDTCPEPSCRGVPLVGYPRRRDGSRDTRRECVSCGQRWVNEKDLTNAGMRVQEQGKSTQSKGTPSPSTQSSVKSEKPVTAAPPAPTASSSSNEPVSPRTKARRAMYETGEAHNINLKRTREAAEEEAKQKAQRKEAEPEATGYTMPEAPSSSKSSATVVPTVSSQRRPFAAAEHRPESSDGKLRVVLVSSGSVASVKIPNIVSELRADGNIEVQVVATDASLHFFDKAAVEKENPGVTVWTDHDEWSDWRKIGDPILHIELRRWADLVVIAPVSADMLAKIAGGLSDNLPLSLLRALSPETPVILCPAMNTFMYSNPMTERHLSIIRDVLHYYILGPQGAGRLACGDVGAGKMTEWKDIVTAIRGFASVFRNRPTDDTSMLDMLLSGAVPNLPIQGDVKPQLDISPVIVTGSGTQTRSTAPARLLPTLRIQPPSEPQIITVRPHTTKPRGSLGGDLFNKTFSRPATVLQYLLFPALLLLHWLFTVSSIVLRVVQSRPAALPELTKPAPSHLALILVPGKGSRKVIAERYVESVRRAVLWAGEWGVNSISVWDGQGLGIQQHAAVTSSLLDLPPSPPSSLPASPPASSSEFSADGLDNDTDGNLGDMTVTKSVHVNTRRFWTRAY